MTEIRNQARPRTPWHLCVVGVVGLLCSAYGAFDHLMTVTRNEAHLAHFPKETVDYWNAMPMWVYWGIGLGGAVLGFTDPGAPRMEGMEMMAALIVGISLFLVLYAIAQMRRGILS
jgi:hypothetical protein